MWEHYDDLPFEVFCTDSKGQRHLISRHRLESEAVHSMNAQNRSGGYSAEYWDWRQVDFLSAYPHSMTTVAERINERAAEQGILPPGTLAADRLGKPLPGISAAIALIKGATPAEAALVELNTHTREVKDIQQTLTTLGYVLKPREVKCMLCNDCGTAQGCPGCHKVDPYLKAYAGSLVNDETGDPYS